MWNEPTENQLRQLPRPYTTEDVHWKDKTIYMHFFLGGCDWYMAEYDEPRRAFFGYAILNDDLANAEWGYVSLDELREVRTKQGFEVDRDLYWTPRKASVIEKIVQAYEHGGSP